MGAVMMTLYGTPQTVALNQRLEQDHMPTTSPGFGISAAADGKRFPYLFPIAATYWSQGAAAIKFAKDQLGGDLKGKKIAYVYYDNPAGKEPLAIIDALQKTEGFDLRTFAVPPPGVELGAQIIDVTQRYHPDFVIAHLFGRSPSVHQGAEGAGFPLKVIGLVWPRPSRYSRGRGTPPRAITMQFAGAGDDYQVRQTSRRYKRGQGRPRRWTNKSSTPWLAARRSGQAITNALKIGGDRSRPPIRSSRARADRQLHARWSRSALKITAEDHEGGGWVRIFQVKGGKFVPATDWIQAYRDVVENAVKTAE